ncbi:MAG: amidohydrolase family protein, partial [Azospirillaceae bacterium]
GGADVMEGAAAVRTMAALHARHGTTSLLATTMTAPEAEIRAALAGVAEAMDTQADDQARILGVHLEGPFISPDKLGAQPPATAAADPDLFDAYCRLAPVRVVTLAPDMTGDAAAIAGMLAVARRRGIRVQIGHSDADYEAAAAWFEAGIDGATHLFNAMSALHHRRPGVAGAVLAHAAHAELIPDLLHVHPGAIRVGLRAIPGLHAVTDATAAAGMPEGDYRLGRHRVRKCGNGVRLADGTLAGSALTMDLALRNLVSVGLDLADAAARVSSLPAAYLGLADRGVIAPGKRADLVVLSPDLTVQQVFVQGVAVPCP